ncbi:hypothetical protein BDR05DRAFT_994462 [Suillus weaverae]|nr:hypothetical protein BDR05DRAFT_994462 [Suillus weaverae]
MSEPGNGTTQTLLLDHTLSSVNTSADQLEFNQSSVDDCLRIVNEFKRGTIEKGDTLLEIQRILQSAITESTLLTQLNFKLGFKHFLNLLDHVASDNEPVQGHEQSVVEREGEDNHQSPESELVTKEKKLHSRLRRRECSEEAESDDSADEHDQIPTDTSRHGEQNSSLSSVMKSGQKKPSTTVGRSRVPQDALVSHFHSGHSFLTVEHLISRRFSPVTIPPPSTLNNPKFLEKGFEIMLTQPTATHNVKTYGDWSITTDLWIEALTFLMPWKEPELRGYK